MIDLSPNSLIHDEQVIAKKLADCGLEAKGYTVKFEEDLQSVEIVIGRTSGASKARFSCIHRAAGSEIVTFEDARMRAAYADFERELYRPRMIADATADLKKLHLFSGFPKRSSFPSVQAYAQALETHCGLAAGSVLKVKGSDVVFDPPREKNVQDFSKRYSKMLAALMYASAIGDLHRLGFIGNEANAGSKSR